MTQSILPSVSTDEQSQFKQNLAIQAIHRAASSGREVITANRNYYVRTDGADTNPGNANTASGAFLTIQKAINTAAALDLSIYAVQINVATGTYTQALTLPNYIGAGLITILGDNTTPANCIINPATGSCVSAFGTLGQYRFTGFEYRTTAAGFAFDINTAYVRIGAARFGTMASGYSHINASEGARVRFDTAYTISGNAAVHWNAVYGSTIWCPGFTITLSGTPAFTYFLQARLASTAIVNGNAFSGSATGTRFNVTENSVAQFLAGLNNPTYLPGNATGTSGTGGIIV